MSEDHSGVLVLDDDAVVGATLASVLEPSGDIPADVVLEIAILPNYGRCLSIVGMAREIAGLTRTNFKLEIDARYLPFDRKAFDVNIEAPDVAPRYSGYVLEGITVGPSPGWLQRRLALAGLNPISNLVDVTNYVMLELGQPMHAFDLDRLPARNISVRRARPGECMYTLDQDVEPREDGSKEEPRELDESVLLITSGDKPVAVAGVIGGLDSQIHDDTTRVLLESANFDFITIRKAMSKLKIITDASTRFSRQVDPAMTVIAIQRATHLLEKIAGAKPDGGIADCYPRPAERRELVVKTSDISRTLGVELDVNEVTTSLERLGFTVEDAGDDALQIEIPGFRPDVTQAADVAEEVIRVIGFDRLENRLLDEPLPRQTQNTRWEYRRRVRNALSGCGLHDVVNYSLTTPESEARMTAAENGSGDAPPYVTIINPSTQDRSSLRRTILGSLMENVVRNHRVRERIALFEIGTVFLPERGDGKLPAEITRLGIVLSGPVRGASWADTTPRTVTFHDLKGIVESLVRRLHVEDVSFSSGSGSPYHPGAAAALLIGGEPVGSLGQIHPAVIEAYDLGERIVFAADVDIDRLTSASSDTYSFRPISRFPPVRQDLALVVDDDVPAQDVMTLVRKSAGDLLADIRLFDLFRGEQIGDGKKSLAFQLTFVSTDRSLSEKEVNAIRESMLEPLREKLGAKIR